MVVASQSAQREKTQREIKTEGFYFFKKNTLFLKVNRFSPICIHYKLNLISVNISLATKLYITIRLHNIKITFCKYFIFFLFWGESLSLIPIMFCHWSPTISSTLCLPSQVLKGHLILSPAQHCLTGLITKVSLS